uniref:Uncharacterized protein n=1 Tax=Anopheles coluzzii TaxID=1518534 RepID=A0A8W7PE50_ANOCL
MATGLRLQIVLRVPVAVVDDYGVGCGQSCIICRLVAEPWYTITFISVQPSNSRCQFGIVESGAITRNGPRIPYSYTEFTNLAFGFEESSIGFPSGPSSTASGAALAPSEVLTLFSSPACSLPVPTTLLASPATPATEPSAAAAPASPPASATSVGARPSFRSEPPSERRSFLLPLGAGDIIPDSSSENRNITSSTYFLRCVLRADRRFELSASISGGGDGGGVLSKSSPSPSDSVTIMRLRRDLLFDPPPLDLLPPLRREEELPPPLGRLRFLLLLLLPPSEPGSLLFLLLFLLLLLVGVSGSGSAVAPSSAASFFSSSSLVGSVLLIFDTGISSKSVTSSIGTPLPLPSVASLVVVMAAAFDWSSPPSTSPPSWSSPSLTEASGALASSSFATSASPSALEDVAASPASFSVDSTASLVVATAAADSSFPSSVPTPPSTTISVLGAAALASFEFCAFINDAND